MTVALLLSDRLTGIRTKYRNPVFQPALSCLPSPATQSSSYYDSVYIGQQLPFCPACTVLSPPTTLFFLRSLVFHSLWIYTQLGTDTKKIIYFRSLFRYLFGFEGHFVQYRTQCCGSGRFLNRIRIRPKITNRIRIISGFILVKVPANLLNIFRYLAPVLRNRAIFPGSGSQVFYPRFRFRFLPLNFKLFLR
jgi:hypothetical protein